MIISHKFKFIFIKTVKTAGTSVEAYLSQYCGEHDTITPVFPALANHRPRNFKGLWNPFPELVSSSVMDKRRCFRDFVRRNKFYNHIPARVARKRIGSAIWNDYFKFCVERNPFDKSLSHYHMINKRSGGNLSLEDYIERGSFCLNYPKYTDSSGNVIVDRIVKYEELTDELGTIFDALGIPFGGSLGTRAKSDYRSNRTPYQEVFTNSQRAIIENVFSKEIELLGYEF
jgi:hypothetical protein